MTPTLRDRALALALFLLVPLAFLPALQGEFLQWDDRANLLDHDRWRGLSLEHLTWMATAFHKGHWQPLTWLSWALDHAVWGLDPRGYHLTNLLLHGLVAVLLFRLLRAQLPRWAGAGAATVGGALVGALWFALHPLRVESVAWVTERRDMLAAVGWLLALSAWLDRKPRRALLWLCVSLLAKAWAITLPVVFLVLDRLVLQRREPWRQLLLEKLPHAALAAGAALLAALAQAHAGAAIALAQHGLAARGLQAAYGLGFYLTQSMLPLWLSPLYPLEQGLRWQEPRLGLALGAVAVLAVLCWRQREKRPWLLAAAASYAVVLLPVLGLLQSGPQLVADRYTYLASVPLAALVAGGCAWLWRRAPRATAVAAAALLLTLAGLTWRQCGSWRDGVTLWQQAERAFPDSWFVQHELADAYDRAGQRDLAMAAWRKAAAGAPAAEAATFHHNIALTLARRGQYREALAEWQQVLARRPDHADALYSCGLSHQRLLELEPAAAFYQRCLAADPRYAMAHFALGEVRLQQGQREAAIASFRAVLTLRPDDGPARARLVELGALRGVRQPCLGARGVRLSSRRFTQHDPIAPPHWHRGR